MYWLSKTSQEDRNKCKQVILEERNGKKNKRMEEENCRAGVNIYVDEEDHEVEGIDGIKKPLPLGTIDRYASAISPENFGSSGVKCFAKKISMTNEGKSAYSTVMSMNFWNGVTLCLRIFVPLIRVLRLVDGDRKPSMGFIYGEIV
ncbi:hypothetical protein F511_28911 [Dorcoceras hygrometricum]|uniref:Uncharacterized protein n=1 Tax=Dorcoceras hygrometricum TaxID=472368 RepID=A0A2Z7ALD9_9LAMI|nr:hypothetical protein F511_28911 [Dorcoceras hygrometricum]